MQFGLFGHPVLVASTFPISLALLAMHQVSAADPQVQTIVTQEARSIAALGAGGGWPYFNLCPECPPDSDDLAAVLLLLEAAQLPERSEIERAPLLRLDANEVAPGLYRTWLSGSEAGRLEVDARFGAELDPVQPEVLAHLLYALLATQGDRYLEAGRNGAQWLLGQRQDGRLPSFNYYGASYGTFQLLRLLDELERFLPQVPPEFDTARIAAREAMCSTQEADGSWRATWVPRGVEQGGGCFCPSATGSVIETAFALLALARLGGAPQRLKGAAAFIASRQQEDGGFAAEPFYYTIGFAPYQTRTLTTALALQALANLPPFGMK